MFVLSWYFLRHDYSVSPCDRSNQWREIACLDWRRGWDSNHPTRFARSDPVGMRPQRFSSSMWLVLSGPSGVIQCYPVQGFVLSSPSGVVLCYLVLSTSCLHLGQQGLTHRDRDVMSHLHRPSPLLPMSCLFYQEPRAFFPRGRTYSSLGHNRKSQTCTSSRMDSNGQLSSRRASCSPIYKSGTLTRTSLRPGVDAPAHDIAPSLARLQQMAGS
jgi:hypothetical protein